jgi:hypothetical protein
MMTSAFDRDSTSSRLNNNSPNFNLEQSQRAVYSYLLSLVKQQEPERVLREFKNLFIHYAAHADNVEVMQHLAEIIWHNNARDFILLIKRCCYILINNWDTKRNHEYIHHLIQGFEEFEYRDRATRSKVISRLHSWLQQFKESSDYQDLCLFINKYDKKQLSPAAVPEQKHWSERYTSYLLVAQYADLNNPQEQRTAARTLSLKLKNKFKFELAMYATHSQLTRARQAKIQNPTSLGDNVLQLIKKIIVKKGYFNYKNLANIFTKQIQGLTYQGFKFSLSNYLLFSLETNKEHALFSRQLADFIQQKIYSEHNEENVDSALILRTCNRLVDYLTTDNGIAPSEQFATLICQGYQLTLAIIFLKLILICPQGRMHLEKRIAELIRYYQKLPEEDCQWAVHFFEVFNIAFAIYADNDVEYSLIKIQKSLDNSAHEDSHLDSYHIFSQYRGWPGLDSNYFP